MRTRIPTLLVAVALLGTGATAARAQNTTVDSRWIAYLGCWESIGGQKSIVCVVPGADTSAIDLVTIENGEVVKAEQMIATGARIETTHGECTGWQSAEWSAVSDRLYLRLEERCPGWGTRTGTGVFAMTRDRQLLYIQGSTVGMKTGVQVQRYREPTTDLVLPSEVKDALDALHLDLSVTAQAHAAATAPLAIDDLVEASRQLDPDVVEAWLVERGGSFTLDRKRLVTLANAGVPSRITDLLVALSYPGVFTINVTAHQGARRAETTESYAGGAGPVFPVASWYAGCSLEYLPFYGSYYCDGFAQAYPFTYGSYGRDYPVVIIFNGSSGSGGGEISRSHGRVINGQGYQEGPGSSADVVSRWGEPRQSISGSSSTGAASPQYTPSSSSSSGEQRTAKPRP